MRFALLADVHGNLAALNAVLTDIARRAPEARVVCAGDVVGYGPDPDPCIEMLAERDAIVIAGNHEEMVLGRRDFERAGGAGILAALWTQDHLSRAGAEWLARLPGSADAGDGVIVCHGDLQSADTYVSTSGQATAALERLERTHPSGRVLVCGHTHHPMLFVSGLGLLLPRVGAELAISQRGPSLINPGSVGQERVQRRPWARYAVLDLEGGVLSYRAIDYDQEATVRRARAVGLRPTIVLLPPSGIVARRVERMRTRWARHKARGRH